MGTVDGLPCGCPRLRYFRRTAGTLVLQCSQYRANCKLGEHGHGEARLVLTLKGGFETRYGPLAIESDAWKVLYRPRFDEHHDRFATTTLCLTVAAPHGGTPWSLGSKPFAIADEAFPALARELSIEMNATDTASRLVLEGLCGELAARLQGCDPNERHAAAWVMRVRDWLEDEYRDPPSLSLIAQDVGRDGSYVAAVFKKNFGMTMGNYVRDLRTWHARGLVSNTAISLADIAHRSGFADQSHFSRVFRKRFSLTPGDYRRRMQ